MVVLMVIAHRCVQQHDSENDMCEYEYYYYLMTSFVCKKCKAKSSREKKM